MRKQRFTGRIDRRKHDEDIAERVIGGVRSSRSAVPADDRATANHRPPRTPRRPRAGRKR